MGGGYSKRSGLMYVDYPTQRRTPKASYHRYKQHIADFRAITPFTAS
jgi:beta-glucosidase